MHYPKYFKPGQKILMRGLDSPSGHFDALTVFFQDHGPGYLDLRLPYRPKVGEGYPFVAEMPFELLSDALGLGLRVTGKFQEYRADQSIIRVGLTSDLKIFQRRYHKRVDITIGLRYTKGQGTMRSFREQWQKNLAILQKCEDPLKLPAFPPCHANLSPGGIRFDINPPVMEADLCLLLIQLKKTEIPICTLAEVVWLGEQEPEKLRPVGLQFLNILELDRTRIERFIKEQPQLEPPPA